MYLIINTIIIINYKVTYTQESLMYLITIVISNKVIQLDDQV
jgi:hypothetical protein